MALSITEVRGWWGRSSQGWSSSWDGRLGGRATGRPEAATTDADRHIYNCSSKSRAAEDIGMPQATHCDAIVIGTSQGGRLLPIALAQAGRKVALIERDNLGGVCVNVGCTPTKTMVASARVAYLARRGAEYGVHTGPISVDLQAVRKRKQDLVEGARSGFESRIKAAQASVQGLDLLLGEAHFIAPETLEIHLKNGETHQITAPMIFIDTGTRP